MLLTEVLDKYKIDGFFCDYSQEHILYPALNGLCPVTKDTDSIYLLKIKQKYDTFVLNFNKMFSYLYEQYQVDTLKAIIHYLSCSQNYSNEEFLFRYTNLLVICGIKSSNIGIKDSNLRFCNNDLTFWFEDKNGNKIQFYTEKIHTTYTADDLKQENVLELEVGLKRNEVDLLKAMAKNEGIEYRTSNIQKIIESLNRATRLQVDKDTFKICLLQLSNNIPCSYPISPVQGIFLNKYTGLFINDLLHKEYHLDKTAFESLGGVLALNYNLEFLIYGDVRYLFKREYGFLAINSKVNSLCIKSVEKLLCGFRYNYDNRNISCIYNPFSKVHVEKCQNMVGFLMKNYEKATSSVFSNCDVIIIKEFIENMLLKHPELLQMHEINIDCARDNIFDKYELMYSVILEKYPSGHPFKNKAFLFDATGFSLAYCLFIVPAKLGNNNMMCDFLNKKLISSKDGKFDMKLFNENYSELEIFIYLFVGIFCTSERYKTFSKLEYEPNGNINKRFEYAFIFKDYKINVEVKALECAPELSDNIDLIKMKNGAGFYKNYFHANNDVDVISSDILDKKKKLKSNYRQVSKNIKKINDKCIVDDNLVNLGFLMINYGTSREEFISYLMHNEHGYLNKNPHNKLDAIVLFSMCADTDFMMKNILEKEHIFVFPNKDLKDWSILSDLRLSNYVSDEEDNPYRMYFNDLYSEYEGIKENGIVTIQKAGYSKEDLRRLQKTIGKHDDLCVSLNWRSF